MSTASFVKSVTLPSGAKLPVLGLGVYLSKPGDEAYEAVLTALKLGYRHIDSARHYFNEADVGRAIQDSGIPREQIFVTSKLFHDGGWSYDHTVEAVKESLEKFQVSYLDLYLLHAPFKPEGRTDAWRALEDMQAQGLIKDIGVSNFGEQHLNELSKTWRVKPAVNQIELHPFYTREPLCKYCRDQGILLEAYTPLTRAKNLTNPTIVAIAKEVDATPAQVLIAWGLSKDFIELPKSVNADRIEQNLNAVKVVLSADQVARLDALDEDKQLCGWDPTRDDYPDDIGFSL